MKKEKIEPTYEYERLWRRIRKNILELINYVKFEIVFNSNMMKNVTIEKRKEIDDFIHLLFEHKWYENF